MLAMNTCIIPTLHKDLCFSSCMILLVGVVGWGWGSGGGGWWGEGCNEFVLCVNNSEIGINAGQDS